MLKKAIETLPNSYNAIIIDCPPGVGFLTTNALVASDRVLIPLQCEFYALEGLSQILRVIKKFIIPNFMNDVCFNQKCSMNKGIFIIYYLITSLPGNNSRIFLMSFPISVSSP